MSYPTIFDPFVAIPAVQGAVTSTPAFRVEDGHSVTLCATALAGAEEVDVYVEHLTAAKKELADADGNVKLTATRPQRRIYGPILLSFAKDATAADCALEIFR